MFKKKEPVFTCELKAICESKWITIKELAETVGVSKKTIQQIQEDKYEPSVTLALALAKVLGCKVEDLFVVMEGE